MITQLLSIFSISNGCTPTDFFGLKPWYQYLQTDKSCNVVNFNFLPANGQSDILLVALAIVDDLLRVAGLVAVAFVVYGGIQYVTSQGSPDQTQKAQRTIQNALIGLVISVLAIATVSFLGNKLG
jgi:amino acid transporter